jgi:hypothetical protein
MRAEEDHLPWEVLEQMLVELESACQRLDLAAIRLILMKAVDGFEPASLSDDLLWRESEPGAVPLESELRVGRVQSAKVTALHKR